MCGPVGESLVHECMVLDGTKCLDRVVRTFSGVLMDGIGDAIRTNERVGMRGRGAYKRRVVLMPMLPPWMMGSGRRAGGSASLGVEEVVYHDES